MPRFISFSFLIAAFFFSQALQAQSEACLNLAKRFSGEPHIKTVGICVSRGASEVSEVCLAENDDNYFVHGYTFSSRFEKKSADRTEAGPVYKDSFGHFQDNPVKQFFGQEGSTFVIDGYHEMKLSAHQGHMGLRTYDNSFMQNFWKPDFQNFRCQPLPPVTIPEGLLSLKDKADHSSGKTIF